MFRRKSQAKEYDREKYTPMIRRSICTGETSAGFVENETGKFREMMLIKTKDDLEEFKKTYGIDEIKTQY